MVEIEPPGDPVVEGLNGAQHGPPARDGKESRVSDFSDFSVYIDADEDVSGQWSVQRFLAFGENRVPRSQVRFSTAIRGSPTTKAVTTDDRDLD